MNRSSRRSPSTMRPAFGLDVAGLALKTNSERIGGSRTSPSRAAPEAVHVDHAARRRTAFPVIDRAAVPLQIAAGAVAEAAAAHAVLAGQRGQGADGAHVLAAVAVAVDAVGDLDEARPRRRVQPGQADDVRLPPGRSSPPRAPAGTRRGARAAAASRRCGRSARPRRATLPQRGHGRSPGRGSRRCRGAVPGASRPPRRIWCGAGR